MIGSLIGPEIIAAIIAVVLAMAGGLGAYFAGKSRGKQQGRIEQARNNIQKSERMRDANASVDRSRPGVSDRLRGGEF